MESHTYSATSGFSSLVLPEAIGEVADVWGAAQLDWAGASEQLCSAWPSG